MPYYPPIRRMPDTMRNRTLNGLSRLRRQLDQELPSRTVTDTLMLGTWNLRNFDDNRFVHGFRTQEDNYYIAEIISRFDVVALQEICEDLTPLDRVMRVLGRNYSYIVSDVTEGPGGNRERMAFIYDTDKVSFRGVAGELVLPDRMQIIDGDGDDAKRRQFSRTPFMCAFQSGWFKFVFTTVHIYFGSDSGPKYKRRVKEIRKVAQFLSKRADRDINRKDLGSHLLVGDFNIKFPGSDGDEALKEEGFTVFRNRKGSNKSQTRFYDQISFKSKQDRVQLANADSHGVFQFFDSIYREDDFADYRSEVIKSVRAKITRLKSEKAAAERRKARARTDKTRNKAEEDIQTAVANIAKWTQALGDDAELKTYYLDDWRTFRASDHLPLWVELKIDFSTEYLEGLAEA
ncbi:endonuclease/exonuclease/phosphatase family protein [Shimia sediminis]|uniref:endonuclease/exonuclease/phosphatase family protein n=1 Tax=Shimia sediminis TaxID=2497945 RepID=UPI000F8D5ACE|nr:endonuclease/exonuclease/phosphatase family protein [Shimia sediminis]